MASPTCLPCPIPAVIPRRLTNGGTPATAPRNFETTAPADGTLLRNGVATTSFTQADINNNAGSNAPNIKVYITETNANPLTDEWVNALFSALVYAGWLENGAQNVDWWPLETGANLGTTCSAPDEGMFTSEAAPNTAYVGYLLASALARPNVRWQSEQLRRALRGRLLQVQQEPLAGQAAGIARQPAVLADDPVTGHDH